VGMRTRTGIRNGASRSTHPTSQVLRRFPECQQTRIRSRTSFVTSVTPFPSLPRGACGPTTGAETSSCTRAASAAWATSPSRRGSVWSTAGPSGGGGRVLRRPRDLLGCWGLFTISTGFFIVVRKIPIFGSNQSSAARSVLLTAGVPSLQSFRPFVPLFLRGPAGDLADDRGRDMAINLTRRRRLDKPPSPIKSQV